MLVIDREILGKGLSPLEEEAVKYLHVPDTDHSQTTFHAKFRQFWRHTALHLLAWNFQTSEQFEKLKEWSTERGKEWAETFRRQGDLSSESDRLTLALKLLDGLVSSFTSSTTVSLH